MGEKLFEMKIDFSPGYRVYYTKHGQKLTILLLGGDKKTQAKDLKLAQPLAGNL